MKAMFFTVILLALLSAGVSAQAWQELTVDGFTLRWATVPGDLLSIELSAPTTGWVAVGFNPTQAMRNANMILGYVASSTTTVRDDFGTAPSAHQDDISLGGTRDVTVDGGSETSGTTEIRFTIPLDSGDQYDRELIVGSTYPVIFAMSANGEDDFSSPHTVTSSSSITIATAALDQSTWGMIKTAGI